MEYSDLRLAIYNQLCTTIPAVSNRVYWGWVAKADTVKPYLIISFTGELPSLNTPLGSFMQFDVLAVGVQGGILSLDPIADDVVTALHNVDITTPAGRIIRCEYRRDARIDFWSEQLNGNLIRLKFWLPTDFWT